MLLLDGQQANSDSAHMFTLLPIGDKQKDQLVALLSQVAAVALVELGEEGHGIGCIQGTQKCAIQYIAEHSPRDAPTQHKPGLDLQGHNQSTDFNK